MRLRSFLCPLLLSASLLVLKNYPYFISYSFSFLDSHQNLSIFLVFLKLLRNMAMFSILFLHFLLLPERFLSLSSTILVKIELAIWSAPCHKIQWTLSFFVLINLLPRNTLSPLLPSLFLPVSGQSILNFQCCFILLYLTFKYCGTPGFQLFSLCICLLGNLITLIASL